MLFAPFAGTQLVHAHTVNTCVNPEAERIKSVAVMELHSSTDFLHADPAHATHGMGEIAVNNILFDSDRLKNLRRLIGLDG